jgi:multidrug efflux pump subunit AcrB
MKLGISGTLTRLSIDSPLTPLFLLISLVLGAMALYALPREEEPQISVPMVDIMVEADGLKATDAVELVTEPLEDIVKGIGAVEHVYSLTEDDRVIVTARFLVGTDEDRATFRVHEEIRANLTRLPIGIPEPVIVGRGINDVPILTLTLAPKPEIADRWTDNALHGIAEELLHEISKVEDVGQTSLVGGRPNQIRVEPDPERLALYGITLNQLVDKVRNANRSFATGWLRDGGRALQVVTGQTLSGVPDIGLLLLTSRDNRPVYVKDVADVVVGARQGESRAWHLSRRADGGLEQRPAVTLAVAKRKGANAVVVAEQILERLERIKGSLVPSGIDIVTTRNYGETAGEKADELLFHLLGATVTIVLIVVVFIGWREGIVVLVVIPTTILLTFFTAWLFGYTINRVSLFALIFSIGILVDDAIVVVENIVRHWHMNDGRPRARAAIEAVAEVGNPTIIATLTIIAALLPMMFVSGLMGPYMSPIPANASAAMVFSFLVAVLLTPWLLLRLDRGRGIDQAADMPADNGGVMGRIYRRIAEPLLARRFRAWLFLGAVGAATVAVSVLFATRDVTVKLLPFDNKSEIQVIVDLPEGEALEATERVLLLAAARLRDLPELSHIQVYAGTAAPFNFNGLVRHYDIRRKPWQGDLQVNLMAKDARDRQSHEIALDIRRRLADLPTPAGTSIKVVEVPPGPPVLATLQAEVYGPDQASRRDATARIRQAFEKIDFIVDVDDTLGVATDRLRFEIDQENLEFHGVRESALYDTIEVLLNGVAIGYSHRGAGTNPVEIAVQLPKGALTPDERLLSTPVEAPGEAADSGAVAEIGDVVRLRREKSSDPVFRHNGRFAEMITAELAGRFEAPVYGMLAVNDALAAMDWSDGARPEIAYHGQPEDESVITLLWDGEWEVTYVTFRDMGLAFFFALVGIYILVVGQFGSFKLPLVIMTPIPLTLIGIVLGHWLFQAPFTATSMIGFIALAGVMIRNSILLVDFIRNARQQGANLRTALLDAGAVRFRPIFLTAVTAMIGAAFILADPIFQGLAISMVFGLASSTALTLLVIPAIYVCLRDDGEAASCTPAASS